MTWTTRNRLTRASASIGFGITDRWELSVMVPSTTFGAVHRFPTSDSATFASRKFRLFRRPGDDSRGAQPLAEPRTADTKLRDFAARRQGRLGGGLGWSIGN